MKENWKDISSRTVSRLTDYLMILKEVLKSKSNINSEDLSIIMNTTAAQVRKDLSTFGEFGIRGKGYNIAKLISHIEEILGINIENKIILIGYGNMGHMISSNENMLGKGFLLSAVFDADEKKIGKEVLDTQLTVRSTEELKEYIKEQNITTAILSVTSYSAQEVANNLIDYGIEGILNLTGFKLTVPENIAVVNVDIASKLQELNFWKNHTENAKAGTL